MCSITAGRAIRWSRARRAFRFIRRLRLLTGDLMVQKRASDSFYETTLQRELDARGVTHLVIMGAQTEFCVDTTCRRAASLGYGVTLVADGHLTGDRAPFTWDQIVAYHNAILPQLVTPNEPIKVQPAAEIAFA